MVVAELVVYEIKNTINSKTYIGSTANIKKRWSRNPFLIRSSLFPANYTKERRIKHSIRMKQWWEQRRGGVSL